MTTGGRTKHDDYREGSREGISRGYFIVTFLSILVLANDKEVEIIQEGLFDDIYVEGKE